MKTGLAVLDIIAEVFIWCSISWWIFVEIRHRLVKGTRPWTILNVYVVLGRKCLRTAMSFAYVVRIIKVTQSDEAPGWLKALTVFIYLVTLIVWYKLIVHNYEDEDDDDFWTKLKSKVKSLVPSILIPAPSKGV